MASHHYSQILRRCFPPPTSLNGRRRPGRMSGSLLVLVGVLLFSAVTYGMWSSTISQFGSTGTGLQKTTRKAVPSTPLEITAVEKQFVYAGLNWTIVRVSGQSVAGRKQSSPGMYVIVVTLQVDNTLAQEVIPGSPYDYISLTVGTQVFTPQDVTLPVAFPAGIRGKVGIVSFLIPQHVSLLTLTLSSSETDGYYPADIDLLLSTSANSAQ